MKRFAGPGLRAVPMGLLEIATSPNDLSIGEWLGIIKNATGSNDFRAFTLWSVCYICVPSGKHFQIASKLMTFCTVTPRLVRDIVGHKKLNGYLVIDVDFWLDNFCFDHQQRKKKWLLCHAGLLLILMVWPCSCLQRISVCSVSVVN